MSATIHELLGQLGSDALDERDKGDKLGRLVQAYMTTDPEWIVDVLPPLNIIENPGVDRGEA
ncbi:hypothetical protein IU510_06245 [Nocardia cyriacigeorgica]|uniref:hypothetical protein n=1 Tax=Nocardia cyriacigeorgica TaxID=135487 RepID=UPI001892E428|nr:hypothetical protein [Nocardia cyriacigeorgica]MBF6097680.1 hypothetical protein [Nocardia cyriacigeorgica]MBF6161677.1 hypothetical protein [Nocardia cyriacigeorgica]MBF6200475.1 hypothetical protein [Nocardia cyriacigeorgica]MBF6342061.1 hypothetical protein [Nocardia cyriacigeorgica]MBF6512975.1 hypothetical protein [Nocardia cyriacigeorgica]